MKFKPASIFEIVRLIDIQPQGQTGFCMLVASSVDAEFINELREELDLQAVGSLGAIDVKNLTAINLVEHLQTRQDAAVLMDGFETWADDQFASLDVNRSRLETGSFLVFLVDLETACRFLNQAPNIRSFLGANIFETAPDLSTMSPEEVEHRLDQLRTHYGLTDSEVIDRATRGDLSSEPHFAEWLVLLERSDLVR